MSIELGNISEKETLPTVVLHHLPCNINADENANIKSYFLPKSSSDNGKEVLTAAFRGRPLDGKVVKVPKDFCGFVVAEKLKPFSEEENRQFEIVGKFDEFTQWYLDSKYAGSNSIDKACETWPGLLANAIHDPVEFIAE